MLRPTETRTRRRWLRTAAIWLAVVTAVVFRAQIGAVLGEWLAGDRGAAAPGESVAFYTCSMDPSVESDHPGSCPICGMALTPVTREDHTSKIVRITASARQEIGLRVAQVASAPLRKRLVASGRVVEQSPAVADRAAIVARIYRGDAGAAQPGQTVAVSIPDLPLVEFTGALVAPLDGDAPGSLRVIIDSPDQALRPGTYVEATIDVELPPRLVVPAQAVLYAGSRRIVFVDLGGGRFEPRTPKLGAQAGELVEVIDGLAAGEHVVVHGTFLLAAESRIRSDGTLWSDNPELAPSKSTPPRKARP